MSSGYGRLVLDANGSGMMAYRSDALRLGLSPLDGARLTSGFALTPPNITFSVGVSEPESVLAKAREVVEALDARTYSWPKNISMPSQSARRDQMTAYTITIDKEQAQALARATEILAQCLPPQGK